MIEEIFSADSKTKEVKVLGITSTAKLEDIRILINGKNIVDSIKIENVKIIAEKGE